MSPVDFNNDNEPRRFLGFFRMKNDEQGDAGETVEPAAGGEVLDPAAGQMIASATAAENGVMSNTSESPAQQQMPPAAQAPPMQQMPPSQMQPSQMQPSQMSPSQMQAQAPPMQQQMLVPTLPGTPPSSRPGSVGGVVHRDLRNGHASEPPGTPRTPTPQHPQNMPPQGMPPQAMPSQNMPPQGMPPRAMPPQNMPPQGMPPQGVPPQGMPPQGMPPQNMSPQGMPPQSMPPQAMPPQSMPPQSMPQQMPVRQMVPQQMQPSQMQAQPLHAQPTPNHHVPPQQMVPQRSAAQGAPPVQPAAQPHEALPHEAMPPTTPVGSTAPEPEAEPSIAQAIFADAAQRERRHTDSVDDAVEEASADTDSYALDSMAAMAMAAEPTFSVDASGHDIAAAVTEAPHKSVTSDAADAQSQLAEPAMASVAAPAAQHVTEKTSPRPAASVGPDNREHQAVEQPTAEAPMSMTRKPIEPEPQVPPMVADAVTIPEVATSAANLATVQQSTPEQSAPVHADAISPNSEATPASSAQLDFVSVEVDLQPIERSIRRNDWVPAVKPGGPERYLAFISRAVAIVARKFPEVLTPKKGDRLDCLIRVIDDDLPAVYPLFDFANRRLGSLAEEITLRNREAPNDVVAECPVSIAVVQRPGPVIGFVSSPTSHRLALTLTGIDHRPVTSVDRLGCSAMSVHAIGVLGCAFSPEISPSRRDRFVEELKRIIETRDWDTELD